MKKTILLISLFSVFFSLATFQNVFAKNNQDKFWEFNSLSVERIKSLLKISKKVQEELKSEIDKTIQNYNNNENSVLTLNIVSSCVAKVKLKNESEQSKKVIYLKSLLLTAVGNDKNRATFRLTKDINFSFEHKQYDHIVPVMDQLKRIQHLCARLDFGERFSYVLLALAEHNQKDRKNIPKVSKRELDEYNLELYLRYRNVKEAKIMKKIWEEDTALAPHSVRDVLLERSHDQKSYYPNELMLMNGHRSLIEKIRSIREAKDTIDIEVLDWIGDEVGILMAEELIKKAQEGLKVRVIIDSMSNGFFGAVPLTMRSIEKNSRIIFDKMMAAGISVQGYTCNPSTDFAVQNSILHPLKIFKRKHEKIFMTDALEMGRSMVSSYAEAQERSPSRVTIAGGMNIGNGYAEVGKKPFIDDDLHIRGPIEDDIRGAFEYNYNWFEEQYKKLRLRRKCLNPYDHGTDEYEDFFKKRSSMKRNRYYSLDTDKKTKRVSVGDLSEYREIGGMAAHLQNWIDLNIDEQRKQEANPQATFKRFKADAQGDMRYIQSRPLDHEQVIEDEWVHLINNARERVYIRNAYFIAPERVKRALMMAAQRGVKVTILTNSLATNKELWYMTASGRLNYAELKMAGVDVREWRGKPKHDQCQTMGDLTEKIDKVFDVLVPAPEDIQDKDYYYTLHSKTAVFDDVSVIGSANMDYISRNWNQENIIVVKSKFFADKMLNERFRTHHDFAKKLSQKDARSLARIPTRDLVEEDFMNCINTSGSPVPECFKETFDEKKKRKFVQIFLRIFCQGEDRSSKKI